MGIPVKLEVFEGPLDLLLHLIEKNKVDIYDIPIVEITNQYMEYIRGMQHEDLNVMSEFLVMAATLLDIKCRMLLPKEVTEEGEEEDPRQELVEQLLQYKMYKYMAFELKDRELDSGQVMYKSPDIPEEILEYAEPVDLDQLLGDLTMAKLGEVFREIMKRQAERLIRSGVNSERLKKKRFLFQINLSMFMNICVSIRGSVSGSFFWNRRVRCISLLLFLQSWK